jgi:hypothetical protein
VGVFLLVLPIMSYGAVAAFPDKAAKMQADAVIKADTV